MHQFCTTTHNFNQIPFSTLNCQATHQYLHFLFCLGKVFIFISRTKEKTCKKRDIN